MGVEMEFNQGKRGFRTRLRLNIGLLLLVILALGMTCYRQTDTISADLLEVAWAYHPQKNTVLELENNANDIAEARIRP